MKFKISSITLVMVLGLCINITAAAAQVYLSDYLGVASGETAYSGNGVHSTASSAGSGFGADVAGYWVSDPDDTISFSNNGVITEYEKGIGANPPRSGEKRIDFNLDAFRNDGFEFNLFHAVVGIDYFSGGQYGSLTNGAEFKVYVDDVLVASQAVNGVNDGSFDINVLLTEDNHTLSLATSTLIFHYNHAAWGDAQLTGSAISEPSALFLMGIALLGLVSYRRVQKNASLEKCD